MENIQGCVEKIIDLTSDMHVLNNRNEDIFFSSSKFFFFSVEKK